MRDFVLSRTAAIIAPMPGSPISFGGFRFDPATGELSGANGSMRLGPQPAQVLSILIAKHGALVTRAELKDALWPDTVVEADQGLNFCIRQIRAALGDEGGDGRFIETLPRRGYRFVFPLDSVESLSAPSEVVGQALAPKARSGVLATILGGLVATVAAVAWLMASRVSERSGTKVALLPLRETSGDPAWVAEVDAQITDRLVAELTAYQRGAIGVIGPVTTSRYLNDTRPHTDIGRELGVEYVMSGNVRQSDSTLFIQLVRVSDGVHVFAFRRRAYPANLDSLTSAVVNGVAAKLGA